MNRRQYLATVVAGGAVSLSGCTNAHSSSPDSQTKTEKSDLSTAKSTCSYEDWPRLSVIEGVKYNSYSGLQLVADEVSVKLDSEIVIRLSNTTDSKQLTGTSKLYDIQKKEGDSWESIYRGTGISRTYNSIQRPPGEIFTWKLTLSADSLARRDESLLAVCPPIEPGQYRFCYYGVNVDSSNHNSVAVKFDVS